MEPQVASEVAEIVGRFFALRREGRRAAIDEVLPDAGDASARARLRTMALGEISRLAPTLTRSTGSSAAPAKLAEATPPSEFPELDGYDIVDLVGRGGMGAVYEAYQRSTGRRVAVKFMLAGEQTEVGRRRFEREVELAARLQHPHVVSVLDSGLDRGRYYFVMEYVEGRPLHVVVTPGQSPLHRVLALLADIAEAADYAHQRGVLHRDLKPSNVLVDERDQVHLLDFGLAKAIEPQAGLDLTISRPGQIVGTLAYMSPEQTRGELDRISVRSDVYSLGAMAYELLTGRPPCSVEGPLGDVLAGIAAREPARPSTLRRELDADIDAIVLKAIEKDPAARYATAAELAGDLRRYLADEPIRARPSGPVRRVSRWVRRHRAIAAVGLAAVAAVVAVTTTYLVKLGAAHERAARVQQFFTRNLGFATPDVAKRATVERRDLLDYAAGRVAQELAGFALEEAEVRHALGVSYLELSLYPEAREQLRQALDIRSRELGENAVETAETHQAFAHVLHQQDEYAAAETHYQAALRVRQAKYGGQSAPVAETLNDLGWLAKDRGDYAVAKTRYQEALRVRRSVCGANHPNVAETLNDLAHLHYAQGEYADAERLFREALAIRLQLHPDKQNTHVAATMASLGSVLNKLGRYHEAGPLLSEALALRESVCGLRHGDTLVSRNEWGLHLVETGRCAEAEPVLRENLRLREEVHGPHHRLVAVSQINLGLALQVEGNLPAAETRYRAALELLTVRYGADHDHPDIAAAMMHLATVLCEQTRLDEAHEVAEQVLAMRMRQAPEGSGAGLGQAYCTRGRVRLALGELADARNDLERGLSLLEQRIAVTHWRVALYRSDLGECLTRQREFERAEPLLTEALASVRAAQGNQSRYTKSVQQRIVQLYEAWGRPADAARFSAPPGNQAGDGE